MIKTGLKTEDKPALSSLLQERGNLTNAAYIYYSQVTDMSVSINIMRDCILSPSGVTVSSHRLYRNCSVCSKQVPDGLIVDL